MSIYDIALTDTEIVEAFEGWDTEFVAYHHTDEHQNVIRRMEYDGFGAVREEIGSSDTVCRLTGKEYDADVKLYYTTLWDAAGNRLNCFQPNLRFAVCAISNVIGTNHVEISTIHGAVHGGTWR